MDSLPALGSRSGATDSGPAGATIAVKAKRTGVHHYPGKDLLVRLGLAVARKLRNSERWKTRRQSEDQLRQMSHAVQQAPVSLCITDTNGNIEYVNLKFTKITGYTLEEVRGENPRFLKSGETPAEVYKQLWDTITAGCEWRGVFCNRRKNGELFWESTSITPIRDAAGKITHYLAAKEDITERKQVEEAALRKSEEYVRWRGRLGESEPSSTTSARTNSIRRRRSSKWRMRWSATTAGRPPFWRACRRRIARRLRTPSNAPMTRQAMADSKMSTA
jgi:PAS domain S-box-containing protein